MLDYQINAIDKVRKYAKSKNTENMDLLEVICRPFNIDVAC